MIAKRALAALGIAGASALLVGAAPAGQRRAHRIEFRPVIAFLPPVSAMTPTTAAVDLRAARQAVATCDDGALAQLAFVPTTTARRDAPSKCVVLPEQPGGKTAARYYLGKAAFTGKSIHTAKAEFAPGQGWTVRLDLTAAGATAWDRLAQQQFHEQVAIVFDGLVQSAPTIQPAQESFASFDGTAQISGTFTERQAKALAASARRANGR